MENPGFFPIEVKNEFVHNLETPQLKPFEFPQHFVVVTSNVTYSLAFRQKRGDVLDHFHVCFRKVSFVELPNVDDVAVQNECFWVDRF